MSAAQRLDVFPQSLRLLTRHRRFQAAVLLRDGLDQRNAERHQQFEDRVSYPKRVVWLPDALTTISPTRRWQALNCPSRKSEAPRHVDRNRLDSERTRLGLAAFRSPRLCY